MMQHVIRAFLVLVSLSIIILIGTDSINMGMAIMLIMAEYIFVVLLNKEFRKSIKVFFKKSGSFGSGSKYYGEVHLETLQQDMEKIEPVAFEHFIGDLFAAKGYKVALTPDTKDFGGDVIAKKKDQCIVIQVKHRDSSDWLVSNDAVQQAVAAMPVYKANKSMVVTNGTFTEHAYNHAAYTHTDLIDGKGLFNMVKEAIQNEKKEVINKETIEEETEELPIVLEGIKEGNLAPAVDTDSTIEQTVEGISDKVINPSADEPMHQSVRKTGIQGENEKNERKKS